MRIRPHLHFHPQKISKMIQKTLVTRLRHFLLGNFVGLWRIVQQDVAGHSKKPTQKQLTDPRPKKFKTEEEQKNEQADEAMRLARMGELKRSMEKTWEEALAEIRKSYT